MRLDPGIKAFSEDLHHKVLVCLNLWALFRILFALAQSVRLLPAFRYELDWCMTMICKGPRLQISFFFV